jgi:hypothetical protein
MKAPIRGRAENLALIICRDTDKGTSGRRAGSGGGKFGYEIGAHQEHQQEGQGVGGGFATFFDKRKTPCKIGRTWGKMARFDMRNGRRKNAKTTLYLYLRIMGHKKNMVANISKPLYIKASK